MDLQAGKAENLELWKKIKDISMDSFHAIYDMLGVQFDFAHGESFYRDRVDEVYECLLKHGVCKEDDGALVVFHPEHKRFAKQPFIIRKKDGASNYATTDLATLSFRQEEWKAEQIIYVTDGRQARSFRTAVHDYPQMVFRRKPRQPGTFAAFGLGQSWVRTTRRSKPGMVNRSNWRIF